MAGTKPAVKTDGKRCQTWVGLRSSSGLGPRAPRRTSLARPEGAGGEVRREDTLQTVKGGVHLCFINNGRKAPLATTLPAGPALPFLVT